jgi:hypothetical protein
VVCEKGGKPYVDLQGDYIDETTMLSAGVEFMTKSREAREMHLDGAKGTILFAFPMTTDIAKAFDIETDTTGLMIGMRCDDDAMLSKFKSGQYTGFSIGGFGG